MVGVFWLFGVGFFMVYLGYLVFGLGVGVFFKIL